MPTADFYFIELTPIGSASASIDTDLEIHKQGLTIGRDYSINFNGSAYLYVFLNTGKHIIESGVWDPDRTITQGNYCFNIAVSN